MGFADWTIEEIKEWYWARRNIERIPCPDLKELERDNDSAMPTL